MKLSQRVQSIKPSPTLAITARAAELRAQGVDVIGLGVGEPDFDTPEHVKSKAISAINEGFTKYTAVDGIPSLKEAIIAKLQQDNQLSYKPEQILVSSGAKQSIFNLLQALLDPGDEVVIPAPYWVSYPDMTLLAGGKPVIVTTEIEQRFKITADQLDAAMNDKTRLVMLNSPSNPTGMAYSREELENLGKVIAKYPEAMVMVDDIYEHILWVDEPFCNLATACPDLQDRTVVINGVSKAYSMTGWRIGYAAGPADLIKAMKKIQGQSTSNPCSISQKAAEAALKGGLDCVKEMVTAFKKRHDYVVDALNKIDGIECSPGDGTFYAFFKVQGLIDKKDGINTDSELVEYFINEAKVAMVPGSAFGAPGYIRLSFATSMEKLKSAIERIGQAA